MILLLQRESALCDIFGAAIDVLCRKYLTDSGWVAPGKVAINGASNGGLLVAACLNRAPHGTFGAGVAEVGVLDMLKVFHRSPFCTLAYNTCSLRTLP